MVKAILFDLDGTLLPMDQDEFTSEYFKALAKAMAKYGYDPKSLTDTVWKGTVAMLKNDGSTTNAERFWQTFAMALGDNAAKDEPLFDRFYENEFDGIKKICGFDGSAAEAVAAAKAKGVYVVLASNPIFPATAQIKRAEWAGVDPSSFDFVTAYDNSRYCKPNVGFYSDIASALGCRTDECIMIGNDVSEDMVAEKTGMRTFLVTDGLINKQNVDISRYMRGTRAELVQWLNKL